MGWSKRLLLILLDIQNAVKNVMQFTSVYLAYGLSRLPPGDIISVFCTRRSRLLILPAQLKDYMVYV